jgi:hypothetical protein
MSKLSDINTTAYLTVLYKTLLDKIYLDNLKSDVGLNNFFNLINKMYSYYQAEYPSVIKREKLIINEYSFVVTFNFSELENMDEFNMKLYNCYVTDSETKEKILVFSYPLHEKILPFILNDMLRQDNLTNSILLNDYVNNYIDQLIMDNKVKYNDSYVNMIFDEYLDTEEFLEENYEGYDELKKELLNNASYEIQTQQNLYNNPTCLSNYLFDLFISSKNKDFFNYLNYLFNKYYNNNETTNKNIEIINELIKELNNQGYSNLAKCVINVVNQVGSDSLVNLLYIKLYGIYNTDEFNSLFIDEDDESRGLR